MSAPLQPDSVQRSDPFFAEVLAQLQQQCDAQARQLQSTSAALANAQLKIQLLEEKLRLARIAKYGKASEKLSDLQLELLEFEPGVSSEEVQAESERGPLVTAPDASQDQSTSKTKRKHPGRQTLPDHLPRIEKIIACTPDQCICGGCGKSTSIIGYEVSEVLDVKPAEYFVRVTKREKRACKKCEEQGVAVAPTPECIIPKSLVSDQVMIDTVVGKYCDSLPIYRQSMILKRDTGLDINVSTMDGWIMRVGELLVPIARVMRIELLGGSYLQADETPVDVQMHDGRGQNHQAYLWQYGSPEGSVVFDFQLGRGREGPKRFLGNFEGILQTDGYVAYEKVGGPKIVRAACWAHARRKFFEALKLYPADARAASVVVAIDELFAIDREACARNLDHTARHALRWEQSRPLLGIVKNRVEAARAEALPSSALGKAANYTLTLWRKLTRFLEYPELELSNNLAENSMRPIAIGRRNWIHVGSAQAGPKVAAILSILETCRRMKAPAREYLAAVLPGLADVSVQRLAEFTPAAWASRNR